MKKSVLSSDYRFSDPQRLSLEPPLVSDSGGAEEERKKAEEERRRMEEEGRSELHEKKVSDFEVSILEEEGRGEDVEDSEKEGGELGGMLLYDCIFSLFLEVSVLVEGGQERQEEEEQLGGAERLENEECAEAHDKSGFFKRLFIFINKFYYLQHCFPLFSFTI